MLGVTSLPSLALMVVSMVVNNRPPRAGARIQHHAHPLPLQHSANLCPMAEGIFGPDHIPGLLSSAGYTKF
jgi:hypothetical protein